MRDVLAHRGPDDGDSFIEGPIGLGHRRLSIIDLGGGHQPMFTEDGRYVIVYNGEIYNYRELRAELESERRAVPHAQSDTEVILRAARARRRRGGRAAERHLRVRVVGPRERAAAAGARSRRHQAAVLRGELPRRRVRVRDQGAVRVGVRAAAPQREASSPNTCCSGRSPATKSCSRGVEVLPPGHTMEIVDGKAVAAAGATGRPRDPVAPFKGSFRDAVDALDAALNPRSAGSSWPTCRSARSAAAASIRA